MDATTWQRAKQWLVDAAALPESEREAYLAERCPDASIRGELLEMLASEATISGIVHGSTLTSGTRLGPYEVDTVIGAGGMGEVYRARDTRLGRDVAIKVLPALFAADRDRLARFEREAKLLASLNHPHICTLHDVGRESGTDFIVMEFVDGERLSDRVSKGPLPVNKALAYAIEIADAIDKAHAVGIVHRDLKPGNVMLTKSGTKLLDFGLARSTQAPTRDVTKTGMILGTLRYMSPEQLSGAEADTRTDVWAFGCVLYHMLTGRAPFDGPSEAAVGAAILGSDPPAVATLVPNVPPSLQRVVDRCLAKAPADRWQSAADLRHELEWIAKDGGKPGGAPRTRSVPPGRERIAWTVATLAIVVAVGLVSFAVWSTRHVAPSAAMRGLSIVLPDSISQAAQLALSRDGRHLAYVGRPRDLSSQPQIWVQDIGESEARALTGTGGTDLLPFWSPDSRSLGFFADKELKTINVATGAIRDLCSAPNGRGGTWAKNTILFVPDSHTGITRISDTSSSTNCQATPVTRPSPDELHRFPSFLDDGVHFVFTTIATKSSVVSISVGSLGGDPITELYGGNSTGTLGRGATQAFVASGMLVFASNGSVLAKALDEKNWRLLDDEIRLSPYVDGDALGTNAFAVADNTFVYRPMDRTPAELKWLTRNGDDAGPPIGAPAFFRSAQLSPDDKQAIVARSDGVQLEFWVIDLVQSSAPRRLTVGSGSEVLWSRDGARVLFRKPVGLFQDRIYSIPVDGSGTEKLEPGQPSDLTSSTSPLGWSNDGSLLFSGSDLWERPPSANASVLMRGDATGGFDNAAITPKGDLVASVGGGGGALYVQPVRRGGGGRQLVTRGRVASPKWRADGHELYYRLRGKVMAVDISGVDILQIGTPHTLFALCGPSYSPSRDGQHFLAAVPQTCGESISPGVIFNWPGLRGK
jgi:serine/threonine protein kinase